MRISGGKARGVTLRVDKKAVHRPAMDRLRQGIFSSLGSEIENARVCDLFAGTGSYGLEALSRGACHATFVEKNRRATAMVKENLAIVAKSMQQPLDSRIVCADVLTFQNSAPPFSVVFVDPPYELIEDATPKLFALFDTLLAENGTVVFEAPGHLEPMADGWTLRKRLGKGIDQPTACLIERA